MQFINVYNVYINFYWDALVHFCIWGPERCMCRCRHRTMAFSGLLEVIFTMRYSFCIDGIAALRRREHFYAFLARLLVDLEHASSVNSWMSMGDPQVVLRSNRRNESGCTHSSWATCCRDLPLADGKKMWVAGTQFMCVSLCVRVFVCMQVCAMFLFIHWFSPLFFENQTWFISSYMFVSEFTCVTDAGQLDDSCFWLGWSGLVCSNGSRFLATSRNGKHQVHQCVQVPAIKSYEPDCAPEPDMGQVSQSGSWQMHLSRDQQIC